VFKAEHDCIDIFLNEAFSALAFIGVMRIGIASLDSLIDLL
jgi:hypothetical protein